MHTDKERRLLAQVKKLHEQNPMLGTRGVRLAMLYPEIPDMQARAIIRAALAVLEREGETVDLHIMIPLVFTPVEPSRVMGSPSSMTVSPTVRVLAS